MKRQPYRPILITDARPSQDDELRSRQIRYLTMMLIRAGCLVLGAILVGLDAPLLWLWLPACAVAMVLLPWLAVLIANDRPAKDEHRRLHRLIHRRAEAVPPHALPAEPPVRRTIDAEP